MLIKLYIHFRKKNKFNISNRADFLIKYDKGIIEIPYDDTYTPESKSMYPIGEEKETEPTWVDIVKSD